MRRKGFSLIELLIVVAIIAALVGVAVPFFQDNLQQAQQTKAKQDLDTIRNAISLHDAQNRPLIGTSLHPLLGRYLQELPRDPWNNDYALDANVGIIISFGADAQAAGVGGDSDQYFYYKPPIKISRVQYVGPWGRPTTMNKFVLTMTKPYEWDCAGQEFQQPVELYSSLYLLRNTRDFSRGDQYHFTEWNAGAGFPNNPDWKQDTSTTDTAQVGLADAVTGIIAIQNSTDVTGRAQAVTPTMAINFDFDDAAGATGMSRFGLTERWLQNGPLDTSIYGEFAQDYRRMPSGIPRYGVGDAARNRGVKIERF